MHSSLDRFIEHIVRSVLIDVAGGSEKTCYRYFRTRCCLNGDIVQRTTMSPKAVRSPDGLALISNDFLCSIKLLIIRSRFIKSANHVLGIAARILGGTAQLQLAVGTSSKYNGGIIDGAVSAIKDILHIGGSYILPNAIYTGRVAILRHRRHRAWRRVRRRRLLCAVAGRQYGIDLSSFLFFSRAGLCLQSKHKISPWGYENRVRLPLLGRGCQPK